MLNNEQRHYLYTRLLFQEYGVLLLSIKQVAILVNRSEITLFRWRTNGIGPYYRKEQDSAKNASIDYPIDAVADFILSNNVRTTMGLPHD